MLNLSLRSHDLNMNGPVATVLHVLWYRQCPHWGPLHTKYLGWPASSGQRHVATGEWGWGGVYNLLGLPVVPVSRA